MTDYAQMAPWDDAKARDLRLRALRVISLHDHNKSDRSPLTRANCGACCVKGYRPRGGWGDDTITGPNYAGWERIYTEAQHPIPARWVKAYRASANQDTPYGMALRRDIETFGWPPVRY